jgi:hypothetical protein
MLRRSSRRSALAFALLASCLLGLGCGGGEEPSVEEPATEAVEDTAQAAEETPPARPAQKQPPKPPSLSEQAETVVRDYYAAVDSSLYRQAWGLLSPALQAEQGGFDAWRDGYSSTLETKASDVEASNVSRRSATVALSLKAIDLDECGDTVEQTFAGTWTLERESQRFLGAVFDVAKIAGGTPVTDPSACPAAGGSAAPAQPTGCDPNYEGACVPPYPPDVDCIDIGEEVEVVGEDVHDLDLGGDEEACEIFF